MNPISFVVLWLALLLAFMAGCSQSTQTPEVEKVYFLHSNLPPKVDPPKTHWTRAVQYVETFDRCWDDKTGREIMEVMHATQEPTDTWNIYENGADCGDFDTEKQAIAAIVVKHPECKVTK